MQDEQNPFPLRGKDYVVETEKWLAANTRSNGFTTEFCENHVGIAMHFKMGSWLRGDDNGGFTGARIASTAEHLSEAAQEVGLSIMPDDDRSFGLHLGRDIYMVCKYASTDTSDTINKQVRTILFSDSKNSNKPIYLP